MNANVLVAKKWHISFFSERRVAREHFRLSFQQTYVILGILVCVLTSYYTYLMNQNATKWYSIRTLQMTNRDLVFRENLLDIRLAEGRSIDAIMSADIISQMQTVEPDKTHFMVMRDSQFAMNTDKKY